MQRHDKDRLIVSVVVGSVLYVVLFLFLNPLDWLERQRFLGPIGPLTVQFEALPSNDKDPVVKDDPEELPEELPEPQEPEKQVLPEPDLQPAKQDPQPTPTPTATASTPAPTWKLAPNLDDSSSSNGPSIRADRGEAGVVSPTGTEHAKVPVPSDQTGTSGVEYDERQPSTSTDETNTVRQVNEPQQSAISDDQRDQISNISSTPSKTRDTRQQQDTKEPPTQKDFESLEELTQNREPASVLSRPEIPKSLQEAGKTKYEVIVSFIITDGGAVTNVAFEKPPENQELAVNIIAALRRWTFVPANESVTVRLRYVVEVS